MVPCFTSLASDHADRARNAHCECSIRIRSTADMVVTRDLKRRDMAELHEPDFLA